MLVIFKKKINLDIYIYNIYEKITILLSGSIISDFLFIIYISFGLIFNHVVASSFQFNFYIYKIYMYIKNIKILKKIKNY